MTDSSTAGLRRSEGVEKAAGAVREAAEALPSFGEEEAFGGMFDRFAGARIVLLGEATHGTSEFYRARDVITRRLIAKHGFNIVAVEADWPDASRIDRYVRHRDPAMSSEMAFARFPTWMWRNTEVLHFVEWLRGHNAARPEGERAEFRGLDVYSLRASMEAVLNYLDHVDPEAARAARRRYACLTPWQSEPEGYGHAVLQGEKDPCEDAAVAQLRELLEHRMEYGRQGREAFLDAAQNARIVRAAEQYYRAMYRGGAASWNLRDRHMFDSLKAVMLARGPGAKAVVWAHNSHIGNASATAMGWQGEFNIGELCRTAFGDDVALIGFGTDRGMVAAADDWGGEMQIKNVLPARPDSYEHIFGRADVDRSVTDLRGPKRAELRNILSQPRLERAIGVVYRPETEFLSHYFEAVLPEQFDAYVWFEETRAVTPLGAERPHGAVETYPFGL
jgi:erythromycin esterase-like protein